MCASLNREFKNHMLTVIKNFFFFGIYNVILLIDSHN